VTPVSTTAAELARYIQAAAKGRQRLIVGIAGPPGSAKSTLASQLVALLSGDAVLVPMDGFHLANSVLDNLGRRQHKGAPDTFDANGYVALLRRLRDQTESVVYAPTFRRDLEEPIAAGIPVYRHTPIVITEGNYLLLETAPWSGVRALLDIAWFLDMDQDTRIHRLVARHHAFGKTVEAAREWAEGSDERNAELVRQSQHRADSVLWLDDSPKSPSARTKSLQSSSTQLLHAATRSTPTSDALGDLSEAGVSIWLDDISRERLTSGDLAVLVENKHVVGVTSNPTIFQKALEKGTAYDDQVRDLKVREVAIDGVIRYLMAYDIRWACDVLRPVYDRTNGEDGRVSIEVDPRRAAETERTIAEAKGLWWLVDRPNVMIKIPATEAGLPAITAAIAAGISVNVTLIFGLDRYDAVVEAYLSGLEKAAMAGIDLSTIRSVASFFVSRVDTEIDKRLDKIGTDEAKALRGKAGIANARLAYERYEKVVASDRWKALEAKGAHRQRPLWASTGVKDPAYDNTMYVVELVAPDVVNTMPEATLDAVAHHGQIRGNTIAGTYPEAQAVLDDLDTVGVSYDEVIELLEVEGVQKFQDSYAQLASAISMQLTGCIA
jgi:transaldolase